MEQVNESDDLTVVSLHAFVLVCDLHALLYGEYVDAAAFHQEQLSFRGICSECLVVHLNTRRCPVVLDGEDEDDWSELWLDVLEGEF